VGVEVNAVFRRAVDDIEWGNDWRPIAGRGELGPGTASEIVFVTSAHGHVSPSSVTAILRHPRFVDARVEVFARHGAQPWEELAELPGRGRNPAPWRASAADRPAGSGCRTQP
jgi:hypothetical protein